MDCFEGSIFGAAFASGDRFVAGAWERSPFGRFADLMWAQPDGTRVLLAGDEHVAAFISSHYSFEEVRIERVDVQGTRLRAGRVLLDLRPGSPTILSLLVRLNLLRRIHGVNDALAGRLLPGVRTRGTTRAGARQRYVVRRLRRLTGSASVDGNDLGPPVVASRPARFGFSESPPFPFCVSLLTLIDDAVTDGS